LVKAHQATTLKIIQQVQKCPSGALSFYMNADIKNVALEE